MIPRPNPSITPLKKLLQLKHKVGKTKKKFIISVSEIKNKNFVKPHNNLPYIMYYFFSIFSALYTNRDQTFTIWWIDNIKTAACGGNGSKFKSLQKWCYYFTKNYAYYIFRWDWDEKYCWQNWSGAR